jgi:hypothetical protein
VLGQANLAFEFLKAGWKGWIYGVGYNIENLSLNKGI